jgi:hypothetical protein
MGQQHRTRLAPPKDFVLAARSVMGAIDFDAFSNPDINRLVQASRFHHRDEDDFELMLAEPWDLPGEKRVLVAPPMSLVTSRRLINKTLREYRAGRVNQAVFWLSHNETVIRAPWLWDFPACIPFRRLRPCWWDDELEVFRNVALSDWSAVFYLPPPDPVAEFQTRVARFHSVFSSLGRVVFNELSGEGDWEKSYEALLKKPYNYRE